MLLYAMGVQILHCRTDWCFYKFRTVSQRKWQTCLYELTLHFIRPECSLLVSKALLGLRDVLSALAILYGGDAGILYGRRIVAGGTIYVEHNIYDNIYVEQEASAQYCLPTYYLPLTSWILSVTPQLPKYFQSDAFWESPFDLFPMWDHICARKTDF